jgi:hypothetical protein
MTTAMQGDTRLYDAIKHGTGMLNDLSARYPTSTTPIRRRILVLSDGEDSGSHVKAFQVSRRRKQLIYPIAR